MIVEPKREYKLIFRNKLGKTVYTLVNDKTNNWNGLDIMFHVKQHGSYLNENAMISIFNLNEKTADLLKHSYSLELQAGYVNKIGTIYKGVIQNNLDNYIKDSNSPSRENTFYCLDYGNDIKPIHINIPSTYTIQQAVQSIVDLVPNIIYNSIHAELLSKTPIGFNYAHHNLIDYITAFKEFSKETNTKIWMSNGQVYCLPKNVSKKIVGENIDLNYSTGMIGSPTYGVANNGIIVKSILNHKISPGNTITVETINPNVAIGLYYFRNFDQNKSTRGKWQIYLVTHQGHLRGRNMWHTSIQTSQYLARE